MSLESVPNTARPEAIAEKDETRLFSFEKPSANADAKRIIVTFDNPGAYNGMAPIVDALVRDPRCKGISVLASGRGSQQFRSDGRFTVFKEVPPAVDTGHPARETVLANLLDETERYRPDIILASKSAKDGPESVALFGGENNLGAQKIFLFVDGWGSAPHLAERITRGEEGVPQIDGVFCYDEIGKRLAMRWLTRIPEAKFIVSGSPVIDDLFVDDSVSFTRAAREKLRFPEDAVAVLYAGDVLREYDAFPGVDREHIDMRSLDRVIQAMRDAAEKEPEKNSPFSYGHIRAILSSIKKNKFVTRLLRKNRLT